MTPGWTPWRVPSRRGPRPVVVPCTNYRPGRRLYPSHLLVKAPDGGLAADSVLLTEQVRVVDKGRLVRRRGALSPAAMEQLNRALSITLDLG